MSADDQRIAAIIKACTLGRIGSTEPELRRFVNWVRNTDELTEAERALMLGAGPDDIREAMTVAEAQATAELDQAEAARDTLRRFLDALEPWATDPTRAGWTLDRILADVRRLDAEAYAHLVTLHHAAYPTGLAEVPR